ncbi:MAG: DUF4440 domain-containing protein [Bacteroidota bacterium]
MKKGILLFFVTILLISCDSKKEISEMNNAVKNTLEGIDISNEIQQANNKFMEAYNTHDAKALAAHTFSSKATVYPPGSPPVTGGSEVIEGFWNAVMASGIDKADIKTTEAFAYGNTAIETGIVKLYDVEGTLLDDAKYLVQWKKEEGQWKIIKDIWNSSMQ